MIRIIAVLLLLLATTWPVRAQGPDIKSVINQQIAAFQREDLPRAFSFASPMIQRMFGTASRFGAMVERGYPMVWRPASVRYGKLRMIEGRNFQTVFFVDQAGKGFEATYEMIETDEGWRINGVTLKEIDIGV